MTFLSAVAAFAGLATGAAMPADVAPGRAGFPLIADGRPARVVTAVAADPAVRAAADGLRADLAKLGGAREAARVAVIIGVRGHDRLIDRLAATHRLDLHRLDGAWEGCVEQVVERPAPGIARALVIVGSDRRGAVFGAYDLSRRAGVSPWTWWADVPVPHRPNLAVAPGIRFDAPKVKYRGIFLNDEDPALGGWAKARFGGLNHAFYARLFELVLRLRGNTIWPAMWGKSLWDDDPESAAVADRMGVVLGTSHHEPLLRANIEWRRYGQGPWDYQKNADRLQAFWRAGLVRNAGREALVTIGMRGDGDEPMTQGAAIPLLERIVADQRRIIREVTGKPPQATPQVWALYKEVQAYYDGGMRVPGDVTLLFSDDNWGNIRRLAGADDRPGGSGIYYHFDYVGGPRNYKWLNVTQVARVWEQMRLAYGRGARTLWIANVGDLKPMELPTSFFLDFAWNPDAWPAERMADYHRLWAAEQFGHGEAAAIGDVLDHETRLISRRTPELLAPESWTQAEWDRVLGDYAGLETDARRAAAALPAAAQDAYFELVLHPVLATATLNRLYATVAANRRCAALGDPQANALADQAQSLFAEDRALARRYEASAGGKWPHMMDQTHIGYTSWQEPKTDELPALDRVGTPRARDTGCGLAPTAAAASSTGAGAFVARDGQIVIDAAHFRSATRADGAGWRIVPGLGRAGAAVTLFPQDARPADIGKGPLLTYPVRLDDPRRVTVTVLAAPSLDVGGSNRLRYAVAIDRERPQVVNLLADPSEAAWSRAVIAHARAGASVHQASAGHHVVRIWAVDPEVTIERVIVGRAAFDPMRLDPAESPRER